MSHDVFVSHSTKDKTVADAVCSTLEKDGIRCWIAPRDIRAGDSWGSSIIKGIEASNIMVIIFSENSNASQQVMREVERAVQKNVVVVPFRIDGVEPTADMEYFLSATHWLDAMTPELDAHLEQLTTTVRSILNQSEDKPATTSNNPTQAVPPPASTSPSTPTSTPAKQPKTLIVGIVALAVVAIVAILVFKPSGSDEAPPPIVSTAEVNPTKESPQVQPPIDTANEPLVEQAATVPDATTTRISVDTADASLAVADTEATPAKIDVEASVPAPKESIPISSSAPAEISVAVPASASAGSSVEVVWTGPAMKGDYISVAKPSSRPGRQHNRYQYVRTGQVVTLRLPDEPGAYEIRYISGGSDIVGASTPIEVTAPNIIIQDIGDVVAGSNFNVVFSGGGFSGDFIAIYKAGDTISRYSSNKYTSRGNSINLKAPDQPGTYVIRYISGQEKLEWAAKEFNVKARQ